MKILVLNCGSSSIKYKLFEKSSILAKGYIERIGLDGPKNHEEGIKLMFKQLLDSKMIKSTSEIDAVGHRVVHGGELSKSSLITASVLKTIEKFSEAAPLHNPVELKGILEVQKHLPKSKNIAVFDTAFHQTIPKKASVYAIPFNYFKEGIKRYGFHGISHHFVAQRASEILGKPMNKLKLITCHLGAGCSITAIENGKSIDTSMGFTPLEGLVMGSRSGDIDPGLILFLMKNKKINLEKMEHILNNQSGTLGISGFSDFREVFNGYSNKEPKCELAFNVFCYRLKKYISSYIGVLDSPDAIVFTGGIGENNADVRKICSQSKVFGVEIDDKENIKVAPYFAAKDKSLKSEGIVSTNASKIKVLVIPTDEELMIARETEKILTD